MIRFWTIPAFSSVIADVMFLEERKSSSDHFLVVLLTDGRLFVYQIESMQLVGDYSLLDLEASVASTPSTTEGRKASTVERREISTYTGLFVSPSHSSEEGEKATEKNSGGKKGKTAAASRRQSGKGAVVAAETINSHDYHSSSSSGSSLVDLNQSVLLGCYSPMHCLLLSLRLPQQQQGEEEDSRDHSNGSGKTSKKRKSEGVAKVSADHRSIDTTVVKSLGQSDRYRNVLLMQFTPEQSLVSLLVMCIPCFVVSRLVLSDYDSLSQSVCLSLSSSLRNPLGDWILFI